jgi:hypothetical protein
VVSKGLAACPSAAEAAVARPGSYRSDETAAPPKKPPQQRLLRFGLVLVAARYDWAAWTAEGGCPYKNLLFNRQAGLVEAGDAGDGCDHHAGEELHGGDVFFVEGAGG